MTNLVMLSVLTYKSAPSIGFMAITGPISRLMIFGFFLVKKYYRYLKPLSKHNQIPLLSYICVQFTVVADPGTGLNIYTFFAGFRAVPLLCII